jgi:hypothetical protein
MMAEEVSGVAIVSVAGACSRAGKTALAVSLLRALRPAAPVAVKFTTTEDVFERCPRGTACIVCDIDVPFRIVEERAVLEQPGTDTARLAEAGAARVIWTIARAGAVAAAWEAVRSRLGPHPLVVMEGSTLVHTARPDLMAFVVHPFLSPRRWKAGTAGLLAMADAVVLNRPRSEARPPSPEVLAALEALRPWPPLVGDVTRPPAEWAPELARRLRRWAGADAAVAAAGLRA